MEELTPLAHGDVQRINLPIPLWLTIVLVALTVAGMFVAGRPRKSARAVEVTLPRVVQTICNSPIARGAVQLVGVVALEVVLVGSWFGPSAVSSNPATTWFYVWFWVGLVPITLMLGDLYHWANPLRTLAMPLARLRGPSQPSAWLDRVGHWPALVGLVVYLVLDSVSQEGDWPRVVAIFVSAYAVINVAGGAWFGPRWFDQCDTFAVYFRLIARLAPVGRRPDGTLVVRNPLSALHDSTVGRGLLAFATTVMAGATLTGVMHFPFWLQFDLIVNPSSGAAAPSLALSAMLVAAMSLLLGAIYLGCTWSIRRFMRTARLGAFGPVLVPLMVAYVCTTHLSAALFESQAGVLLASGGGAIDYGFISTSTLALLQFGIVLTGSVLAATTARRIMFQTVEPRFQRLSSIPLAAMVMAYSLIGVLIVAG